MAVELKDCVLILSLVSIVTANHCPSWFTNTTGHCECGPKLKGAVKCSKKTGQVDVSIGWCMTFTEGTVVTGICPYTYISNTTSRIYSSVPSDPTELNAAICGPFNREGFFCGHCMEGFGPATYSFALHCSNCSAISTGSAITLYLLLKFVPITIFFVIVLVFNFNMISGPMLGYIIFCQAHDIAVIDNTFSYYLLLSYLSPPFQLLFRISLAVSGIWNLNYFKFIIPPLCISSKMTDIHIHMLSYATALYPVLLVCITYLAAESHVQDLKGMRVLVRLFSRCYCGKWNGSKSVIHAFATFMFLSFSWVTYETYAVLAGSSVYDINGSVIKTVLYFDPNIVQYSSAHIPYLVTAVTLLFFLVLCPALALCLYPTRIYEKISQCFSPRKRIVFTIFAETLQGSFKDGLCGTRDFRMVPGTILLTGSLSALVLSCLTGSSNNPHGNGALSIGFMLIIISVSLSYLRPCKSLAMNISLSFHFLMTGVLALLMALWVQDFLISTETLAILLAVLPTIPHIVMLLWATYNATKYIHTNHQNCLQRALAVINLVSLTLCKKCHGEPDLPPVQAASAAEFQPLLAP